MVWTQTPNVVAAAQPEQDAAASAASSAPMSSAAPAAADIESANASPSATASCSRVSGGSAAAAASGNGPSQQRILLEGCEVSYEAHGVVDMPGSYRRLRVQCLLHCGEPRCGKTRSFGVKSAIASGLGDDEPYAYLGTWLRAGQHHADADSHKRFTPSNAMVKAYFASQGW